MEYRQGVTHQLGEGVWTERRQRIGVLLALVSVLCWSSGALVYCSIGAIPVFQILAIAQLLGGGLGLLFDGKKPRVLWKQVRRRWHFVLLLLINQVGYVFAFREAPAAHVDLLHYLWPTLLVAGESLCFGKGMRRLQIAGLVTCFLGICVLFAPDLLESSIKASYLVGYGVAVVAALSWTIYCLLASRGRGKGSSSVDIFTGGVGLAILHTIFGSWTPMSGGELTAITMVGLFVYGLAFPCWRFARLMGPPATIGGMANAIPVLSILWLVLGGVVGFSWTLLFASLLVSGGCWLLTVQLKKSFRLPMIRSASLARWVRYRGLPLRRPAKTGSRTVLWSSKR